MKGTFPIDKFQEIQTPFYYYDTNVLRQTLKTINEEAGKHEGFEVHYAVKANANPKVLNIICQAGLGADCVSGGEIQAAIKAGFPASKIVYAGVGKSDWEINLGLEKGIFCFNVESIPELEIINELAEKQNKIAQVCFRINPDVGAHTHAKHHNRSGRKQVRNCHARHGSRNRRGCQDEEHPVPRTALPHRKPDPRHGGFRGTLQPYQRTSEPA